MYNYKRWPPPAPPHRQLDVKRRMALILSLSATGRPPIARRHVPPPSPSKPEPFAQSRRPASRRRHRDGRVTEPQTFGVPRWPTMPFLTWATYPWPMWTAPQYSALLMPCGRLAPPPAARCCGGSAPFCAMLRRTAGAPTIILPMTECCTMPTCRRCPAAASSPHYTGSSSLRSWPLWMVWRAGTPCPPFLHLDGVALRRNSRRPLVRTLV